MLADAFSDYPWTRWTVDQTEHTDRIEGLQRLVMERVALPYGEVWVAVDDRDDRDDVLSVAMWSLSTTSVPPSDLEQIGAEQAALEGVRHAASLAADEIVARLRPKAPHYYLGAVGTRTSHQQRGLGTAVLTPLLDRARAAHVDVYLETSASTNVAFYQQLGFVTVDELTIPEGGPAVWAMLLRHSSVVDQRAVD